MFPYPWDVFYGSIWETAHREGSEMGGPFRNSLEGDWMNVLPHLKPVEPPFSSFRLGATGGMRCAPLPLGEP